MPHLATHLGHFEQAMRPSCDRAGGIGGAATGRAVRVLRPAASAAAGRLAGRQRANGLDADLAWQPELWRALVERSTPIPRTSATRRPSPGCGRARPTCRRGCRCSGIPGWRSTEIELLDALSTHHDLHLWLPHPSDDLWQKLGTASRRDPAARRHQPPRGRPSPAGHARPRPARAATQPARRRADRRISAPTQDRPETLLGWLQSDIGANAVRPHGRELAEDDRSVQVHSCHGPARQIDVLREVLLGLLADDPTLEPRDILVMCPDIETYAPLIVADFGLGEVVTARTRRTGCGSGSPTAR